MDGSKDEPPISPAPPMATMLAEVPNAAVPEIAYVPPLVRRAQDGDVAAFEQLYRDNVDRVFALCLRMAADRTKAEELTQDVFVRAWERLGSFEGRSAFSTWLHRMAVNVVLGEKRSAGVRSARITVTDDLEAFDRPRLTSDPGTRMDLERAIAGLPKGARTVFVLHDVEGYKHEEIGRMHGWAVGTCKAQLHRARKLLREALNR
ncbi:MAG: polymerase sigma factor, sigma-70 family [Gemmatimonadetes bacterium]|nr:polymerase sigma factor, sigma-70 family [Gemmatimonadota bacterium]